MGTPLWAPRFGHPALGTPLWAMGRLGRSASDLGSSTHSGAAAPKLFYRPHSQRAAPSSARTEVAHPAPFYQARWCTLSMDGTSPSSLLRAHSCSARGATWPRGTACPKVTRLAAASVGPRGHAPPQKPTRLPRATFWARAERHREATAAAPLCLHRVADSAAPTLTGGTSSAAMPTRVQCRLLQCGACATACGQACAAWATAAASSSRCPCAPPPSGGRSR